MLDFFKDFAILLMASKLLSLLARRLHAPQVIGQIIAGLIVGPCVLGWVTTNDTISTFAEMGVILLMFGTGLDTNLKQLLKAGPISFLVACVGVFVPLGAGYLLYSIFYGFAPVGSDEFYRALFIGTIMTATSVSITVAVLQELGKLNSFVGTTIVGAAVIDDLIGIIVLTCVVGSGSGSEGGLGTVLLHTGLFCVVSVVGGYLIYLIARKIDADHPRTHRLSVFSIAFCFAMAYISETYFGVADITGAYVAGIILCSVQDSHYVETKVETADYLFFGPMFFASVGLKTDISGLTPNILLFSVCFVIVAMVTKIIGCGLAAKACKFNFRDSLKVGIGMMTRGEVALIVSQKGLSVGKLDPVYFTSVILLILCSSILTPLVLGTLYKGEKDDVPAETAAAK